MREHEVDEYLTTAGAASLLGCTPDWVRRLELRGLLAALKTTSGTRTFRRSDVEAFARSRRSVTPEGAK